MRTDKRNNTRRNWAGRILLTAYLCLLSVGIFHQHTTLPASEDTFCQDCRDNKHNNHLGDSDTDHQPAGECELCHFLHTSYTCPNEATLWLLPQVTTDNTCEKERGPQAPFNLHFHLRAPPTTV